MRYLERLQPLALLVLRVVLGITLIVHGYPKLGTGFSGFTHFIESLGMRPWMAYIPAGIEVFGGSALILGLFTRCISFAVVIEMAVVIAKVEFKHGFKGGYEVPLAIAAMAFTLIFFGGGPISLDAVRGGGGYRGKSK